MTALALFTSIFLLPMVIGYWYGRNNKTPEQLRIESEGSEQ